MRFCITISGRVQGVYFRKFVLENALELGISGFVMNLPNGNVYCEAQGPKEKLEIFIDLCGEGPPMSRVTAVEVETKAPSEFHGFEIRR